MWLAVGVVGLVLAVSAPASAGSWTHARVGHGLDDGAWLGRDMQTFTGSAGTAIAIDPHDPNRIVAAPYHTEDGGATWQPFGAPLAQSNLNIADVYAADGRLYELAQGRYENELWVSSDNGATWQQQFPGPGGYDPSFPIIVDPSDPQHLIAASSYTGLLSSTDAGVTFQLDVDLGIIVSLAAAQDGIMLASGWGYAGRPGPWISTDHGAAWSQIGGVGLQTPTLVSVAFSGAGHQRLFAADATLTYGKAVLVASGDAGATFTRPAAVGLCAAHAGDSLSTVIGSPSDADVLYATCVSGEIDRSDDAGASFTGIPGPYQVPGVAVDPANADHVWLDEGPRGGIAESTDGGRTLTERTNGIGGAAISLVQATPDGTLIASNGTSTWRSTDGGTTFTPLREIMNAAPDGAWNAWVVDPTAPRTLYAVATDGSSVERSTDGGVSWQPRGKPDPNRFQRQDALTIDGAGRLYVLDLWNNVYVSSDGGLSWTSARPAPGGTAYATLYADASRSGVLYLLYGAMRLARSDDAGLTWSTQDTPGGTLTRSLYAGAGLECISGPPLARPTATARQVCSLDAGASWYDATVGAGGDVWFAPASASGDEPLVSLAGGAPLQRSTDGGHTWTRTGGGPGTPTSVSPPSLAFGDQDAGAGTFPGAGPIAVLDAGATIVAGTSDGVSIWTPAGSLDAAVDLSVPAAATTGAPFAVTATVTNRGTFDASPTIDLAPSASLTVRAASPSQGSCVLWHCAIGTIHASGEATVTFTLVAAHAGTAAVGAHITLPSDENASDDDAAGSVVVSDAPPVLVDDAAALTAPPSAIVGQPFTVSATVSSVGSAAASPTITLALPPGVMVAAATPSQGTCSSAMCTLGSIAAGSHATVGFSLVATAAGTAALHVQAATPGDANSGNDQASATVEVTAPPVPLGHQPGASLRSSSLVVTRGVTTVRIACPAARTVGCHGTLTLQSASRLRPSKGATPRTIGFGSARVNLAAGKTAAVHVRVPVASARLLRTLRHAKVRIGCTLSSPRAVTTRVVTAHG
jgi:hypothetical protein